MPVYSASSTQWPLLQSKTEQKFKSGLFNVSAEFIRPVGNTALPTQIETSIGPVNVWPEPTVSVGTDGFERINATGYDIWNEDKNQIKTLSKVEITATLTTWVTADGMGNWVSGRKNYLFLKSFYGSAVKFSYCTKNELDLTAIELPAGSPFFTPPADEASIFSAFGVVLGPLENYYSHPTLKTPATLTPTYTSAWDLVDMQSQNFGGVFEVFNFFQGVFTINFGPFYSKTEHDIHFP